jgi:SAM-dependent methyltransferase
LLFRRNEPHNIFPKLLFDVCRCRGCGLIFLNPIPSWNLLSKYYLALDEIEASQIKSSEKPTQILRPFLSLIKRGEVNQKNLRLLDVGCGDGAYLSDMRLKGLEVYGVEPDLIKVRIAQGKSLKVFPGTLMELDGFINYFHVITLNHVLEHVPNPHETLEKCRELLTRKGTLIIQVPRADSFLARVFTRDCQSFVVPLHLFGYSLSNMMTLLKLHDFEISRIRDIPNPLSFVLSVSLKFSGAENRVTGLQRRLLLGAGFLFELVAMLFRKTTNLEVWAQGC